MQTQLSHFPLNTYMSFKNIARWNLGTDRTMDKKYNEASSKFFGFNQQLKNTQPINTQ